MIAPVHYKGISMPHTCKKKQSAANRQYYQDHKKACLKRSRDRREAAREFIRECKTGRRCFDCRKQYPWYVYDFDHRPGTHKRYSVSSMPTKNPSIKAIVEEMNKCDLVCSNCHRLRTFAYEELYGCKTRNKVY